MKREHLEVLASWKWVRLAALVLVVSALASKAATEEHLNKRFAVAAGGTLVVEVGFGSIDVRTNATSEVVVDAWRKIGRKNKAAEEAYLRENPIELTQDGSVVTIRCRGKAGSTGSFWSRRTQDTAKYTLTVPPEFNGKLKTGGGGIDVSDLTGKLEAHSGGGGLSFLRLKGPVDGDTGGGGVKAVGCQGTLKLNSGGGGVEVVGGSGAVEGRTGGGQVSVKKFEGPVRVSSGGGGLVLEDVSGETSGSTGGGSISLVLPWELSGKVELSTGGGGISVSAPAGLAFSLDAQTAGGSVSTELPVTVSGKAERGRLCGPVNGGGKAVVLRSGGGHIDVNKR